MNVVVTVLRLGIDTLACKMQRSVTVVVEPMTDMAPSRTQLAIALVQATAVNFVGHIGTAMCMMSNP